MKKLDLQQIYEYVEKHISIFHQRRLDYVQNRVDLLKIKPKRKGSKVLATSLGFRARFQACLRSYKADPETKLSSPNLL